MTDIKSMTNDELISYRDDILEFFNKNDDSDIRNLKDAHKELLQRLEEGSKAIELINNINVSLFWDGKLQNLDVLLGRLEEGKEYEKRYDAISEHCKYLFERAFEIASEKYDLACCGNCNHTNFCDYTTDRCNANNYCDKWQSDNMTRTGREI